MVRKLVIMLLLGTGICSQGCVQLYDCVDSQIIECRGKSVAKKAWKRHDDYWASEPHAKDFEKGFRAGYYAVMQGKGTRPPTLPPRKYWSSCNMKEDCRERMVAWFNGYASGANVAMGDGVDNLCRIVTAEELYRKPPTVAPELKRHHVAEEIDPVPTIIPEAPPEDKADTPPVPEQNLPPAPEKIEKINYSVIVPPPSSPNPNLHVLPPLPDDSPKRQPVTPYLQTLDLFDNALQVKKRQHHTDNN